MERVPSDLFLPVDEYEAVARRVDTYRHLLVDAAGKKLLGQVVEQ